jgi:hypothetical protein
MREVSKTPRPTGLRRNRLTDRDRQLLRFLAIARYLSTEQIGRLVFPARRPTVIGERLSWLAGAGRKPFDGPPLRRLRYPTPEGGIRAAWALTPVGYAQVQGTASGIVSVPSHADVAEAFLAHTIALNDLLVGLVAALMERRVAKVTQELGPKPHRLERARRLAGLYAQARGLPFRWIGEDAGALPWSEYDLKAGEKRGRLIEPDATLELPSAGERWFVECEMGTQPIVSSRTDRQGATMAKVERYEKFLSSIADPQSRATYYAKAFPDGWPVTVLFLVQNASREASVNEALAEWREKRGGQTRIRAVAQMLPKALAELLPRLGAPAPPKPLVLAPEEFASLRGFYDAAANPVKAARDAARALGRVPPEYPEHTHEVQALIARLLQEHTSRQ